MCHKNAACLCLLAELALWRCVTDAVLPREPGNCTYLCCNFGTKANSSISGWVGTPTMWVPGTARTIQFGVNFGTFFHISLPTPTQSYQLLKSPRPSHSVAVHFPPEFCFCSLRIFADHSFFFIAIAVAMNCHVCGLRSYAQAGANMEELMKDPTLMAEAQRQMQAMMGGAAA